MITKTLKDNSSDNPDQEYLTKAELSWIKEMSDARKEQGRTVFLLHFNIQDFVFDPKHPPSDPEHLLTIKEYLFQRLAIKRHIVLEYSLHSGVQAVSGDPELGGKGIGTKVTESPVKPFNAKAFKKLWEEVAQKASVNPFSIVPSQGQHESGKPDNWTQPRYVMPLLKRVFNQKYWVDQQEPSSSPSKDTDRELTPLSVGLIIDYLHHLAPAPGGIIVRHDIPEIIETLQSWATNPEMHQRNHLILALTPEIAAVDPELTRTDSYLERIRINRPDRIERAEFLQWLARFEKYSALKEDGKVDDLANRASGMNYRELRDFITTLTNNTNKWAEDLAARRADIIRRESGGLLEPKESDYGLDDVAGYNYITNEVNRRLPRIRTGEADITGILFNGPPGTGKSFYASALAKSGGVNMVVIRNLRGMYVGQSERNLEQILEVAKTLAPVMIFVDEIDQVFASRDRSLDTSGGVEQRLLGRLLEFMDDKGNQGKVIWIAASNRPDLIDPALLSRFKLRLPFLLPDRSTCIEMLARKLPHQAKFRWQSEAWIEEVLDEVVGKYSGRELETIVRQAFWKAQDDAALLTDQSEDASKFLAQRRQQLDEYHLTMPETPLETSDSDDATFEVHGQYLLEAVRDAEVGHDEQAYRLQSLHALNSVPFTSSALIEAIQTALPEDAPEIVDANRQLNKKAIGRLIEELSPYTGRSYR